MKTEFLKGLGIVEQSVIDAIMAENGKDINAVKSNTTQLETQIENLKNQISERDSQLKGLKESAKDNEDLTNKITELENANKKASEDYENKIAAIQKTHAIESGVRDAKAKNVKAVMALLDADKITLKDGKVEGLAEQLDALSKGEDTSFLFGAVETVPPVIGTNPSNPPTNGGNNPPTATTLKDAIMKSLGN